MSVGGAVKLSRSLLDHAILRGGVPGHYFKLFVAMVLLANWSGRRWWGGTRYIEIPAGSFVTSAAKMCERLGISRQEYRSARNYLRKCGLITSETTNRWEMVSIVNWPDYQWEKRPQQPAKPPAGTNDNQRITSDYPQGQPWEQPADLAMEHPQSESLGANTRKRQNHQVNQPITSDYFRDQPQKEVKKSEVLKSSSEKLFPKLQASSPLASEVTSDQSDDDRPKESLSAEGQTTEPPHTTPRQELCALVKRTTGRTPSRKDLDQIQVEVESRGGNLTAFVEDIRPRLKRLREPAGRPFYLSQARKLNTPGELPEPEPVLASRAEMDLAIAQACGRQRRDGTIIQTCERCCGAGKVNGTYCTCQHGVVLMQLERQQAERDSSPKEGSDMTPEAP